MDASHVGLVLAVLSALFNGSFGVFTKLPQARGVAPLVMNYWIAEGFAISGLALLAVPPRVFCWHGVLSGALFVLSAANAVTAIGLVGLSAATGVWCGTAVVVSFFYGVAVAGDKVERMGQAVLALIVILAGIAGVALASWAGGNGGRAGRGQTEDGEGSGDSEESLLHATESGAADVEAALRFRQRLHPANRALLGLLTAVLAGGIGGLILAPMLKAPPAARSIHYVPSMAVGALLLAPAVTAILTSTSTSISFTQATSSRAAGPGMAAGIVWNVGNMCCIGAVTNPRVGLAVAMPIMQCGLFVAGLWGILLFGEIRGWRALTLYSLSGGALVAGAALLAAAKGG